VSDDEETKFRVARSTAETRLKLAVATGRWRDAAREAEMCADLDDRVKAGRAAAGPRNIVGRVKARG